MTFGVNKALNLKDVWNSNHYAFKFIDGFNQN